MSEHKSKFFKGEKVIIITDPVNQLRGKTRIGTVVSINKHPLGILINKDQVKEVDLYNVQVIEGEDIFQEFTKILYNLDEDSLMHYSEVAEALYC